VSLAPSQNAVRQNVLTVVSIGAVACIAADMVHEALGHGTVSWLAKDPILAISTVALQNALPNRAVSAAGTNANCLVGAASLLFFRRQKSFTSWTCFLYLFAIFNLLNSGYLVISATLNNGDWANVIAGLEPWWLWRGLIGVLGAAVYYGSLRWAASLPAQFKPSPEDIRRRALPAYLAGGAVMTLASVFNPISPRLILMSGVGASFGLSAGMLFIPAMMPSPAVAESENWQDQSISWPWLIAAIVCSGVFIAVLGPGIKFSH
jgi:hypothetical protein